MNFPRALGPFQVDPAHEAELRDGQTTASGQRGMTFLMAPVTLDGRAVPNAICWNLAGAD
jgi:hypothetical protein